MFHPQEGAERQLLQPRSALVSMRKSPIEPTLYKVKGQNDNSFYFSLFTDEPLKMDVSPARRGRKTTFTTPKCIGEYAEVTDRAQQRVKIPSDD
jgi:hypothetical protein